MLRQACARQLAQCHPIVQMRKLRLGEAKSHASHSEPQLARGTAQITQPSHAVVPAQPLPTPSLEQASGQPGAPGAQCEAPAGGQRCQVARWTHPGPSPALDAQARLAVRGVGLENGLSVLKYSAKRPLLTPWSTARSEGLKGPGIWWLAGCPYIRGWCRQDLQGKAVSKGCTSRVSLRSLPDSPSLRKSIF